MQEVNSLCTDSGPLLDEYCIVGIPHNTAIYLSLLEVKCIIICVLYVDVC